MHNCSVFTVATIDLLPFHMVKATAIFTVYRFRVVIAAKNRISLHLVKNGYRNKSMPVFVDFFLFIRRIVGAFCRCLLASTALVGRLVGHRFLNLPDAHVSPNLSWTVSLLRCCRGRRYCKELRNRAEEVVTQALKLYSTKGLKKAVQYLVASNFISDTPRWALDLTWVSLPWLLHAISRRSSLSLLFSPFFFPHFFSLFTRVLSLVLSLTKSDYSPRMLCCCDIPRADTDCQHPLFLLILLLFFAGISRTFSEYTRTIWIRWASENFWESLTSTK